MMLDISKADWKLFRERISGWQEAYMERLTREYIELLSSDELPAYLDVNGDGKVSIGDVTALIDMLLNRN